MPVLNEFLIALEIMYALFSSALALSLSSTNKTLYFSLSLFIPFAESAREKLLLHSVCGVLCAVCLYQPPPPPPRWI
jgi:hypothetical protein